MHEVLHTRERLRGAIHAVDLVEDKRSRVWTRATSWATNRPTPMAAADTRPFLVITIVHDEHARPAALTQALGDAYERALRASAGKAIAGLEPVELPIRTKEFAALRRALQLPGDEIALYDLFPLASHLDGQSRRVAGQLLAADALWTLESQGLLGGVPLNVHIAAPRGWDPDPKQLHTRLMQAGALDIAPEGIATFNEIKAAWDRSR